MRNDAKLADQHAQVGTENENGKGQGGAAVGGRAVTLSKVIMLLVIAALGLLYISGWGWAQPNRGANKSGGQRVNEFDSQINGNAQQLLEQGRQIFRFETFGDEAYWSDKLKLHQAIAGAKLGGVGPGVSPKTALAVGLKVDMDALPADLVAKVKRGEVNLDDPATTLALIKLNAVLGVKGTFNSDGSLKALGLSCAVCHSTVDDAFMPGIGHRLHGWPNRDLNAGQITSLPPDTSALTQL